MEDISSKSQKVAIITPNYNKGAFVVDCVKSVLSQTYSNWELWFVDDNSSDDSFELAKNSTRDKRCHFLTNDSDFKGGNACRNLALEKTDADFVIFLDSDDLLMPTCLEDRMKDFSRFPDLGFIVYPMGLFFNEIGDMDVISNIPTNESPLNRFLRRDIVWLISGPIWKKDTLSFLDGFNLKLHSQQDYDLHVRSLIKGIPYKYIHKDPDVYYRRNTESLPRASSQSIDHFRQRYEMVLNHHDLLASENLLGREEKALIARNILDLAQMMRWHIGTLGKGATIEAMDMWNKVKELDLIPQKQYLIGMSYLKFKHNMHFNRIPRVAKRLEMYFRKKLGGLIHISENTTYCKVKLSDYKQ